MVLPRAASLAGAPRYGAREGRTAERGGVVGRIPEEDIQRVRDATDILGVVGEAVVLKQKGRLYWGCCPFHNEKTASFKVDPSTQMFHCFGCGAGGSVFDFVMRTDNLDFPDAVRLLAERAHIEVREEGGTGPGRGKRDRLHAACDAAAAYYHRVLVTSKQAGPAKARAYLKSRGFGIEVAKRFGLGYAPGAEALTLHLREKGFADDEILEANLALPEERGGRLRVKDRFRDRLMFPIRDHVGKAVGFGGRVLGDGQPKYLNTGDTPVFHKSRNLYGIDRAKNAIVAAREAVVVEGYTDVIALHEAGMTNVVATLGTALTAEHTKLLGRFTKRVVYLFDGDAAGQRAALRAADLVDWKAVSAPGASGVDMAVALIPGGKDPADWVTEHGADEMRAVIAAAVPLLQFVIDRRLESHDLNTPEGRSAALASTAGALAAVRGSMLEHDYANRVADRLLVDEATVRRAVSGAKADLGAQAGARPGVAAPGEAPEAVSAAPPAELLPESAASREALRMIATFPALRARASSLAAEGLITSPVMVSLLKCLAEAGALTGAELLEHVRARDPLAADALSGISRVDGLADGKVNSTFRGIVSKLKETALERRILQMRAEMKSLDPVTEREARDRLFAEAAALQRELLELRRTGQESEPDTGS
ncbi:MAG: DNA primase [Actinobacteria bacterium]|nr:MAG: DNA primase [Actinomycetota bacterium]